MIEQIPLNSYTDWGSAARSTIYWMSEGADRLGEDRTDIEGSMLLMGKRLRQATELVIDEGARWDLVDKLTDSAYTIGSHAILLLRHVDAWDCEDMTDLLIRKQHDYGHGNIMNFGMTGVAVRMCDKLERYQNLKSRVITGPMNESLIDTMMDLVGYAAIASMLEDETFGLPL